MSYITKCCLILLLFALQANSFFIVPGVGKKELYCIELDIYIGLRFRKEYFAFSVPQITHHDAAMFWVRVAGQGSTVRVRRMHGATWGAVLGGT